MSDLDTTQLLGTFFDEADEHLATMETSLLALEVDPSAREHIDAVFRAAHSIKGGCGVFGFVDLLRFTHALENLLQRVREGALTATPSLVELLLRAKDTAVELLASAREHTAPPSSAVDVLAEIEEITPARAPLDSDDPVIRRILAMSAEGGGLFSSSPPRPQSLVVKFTPAPDVLARGLDPLLPLLALADLGDVESATLEAPGLPSLDDLDLDRCHLSFTVVLVTTAPIGRIRDVFAFFEAPSVVDVEVRPVRLPSVHVIDVPTHLPSVRPRIDVQVAVPAPPPVIHVQGVVRPEPPATPAAPVARATVRVDTDKIDKIINLVGELIIAHSIVTAAMSDGTEGGALRLRQGVTSFGRSMRELQDRVLSVRMVPIGTVFDRFPRLVRDTASMLGKRIELTIEGGGTELDKAMVEKIVDPLTHLVRNACDHGVESPEDRLRAGKGEEGHVRLRAFHQGGSVVIELHDDGRGLDTERIRRKAVDMGLLGEDDAPSEDELHALVFAAGLSTAKVVSDVSGRGVGMDVVKRNIEAMNGTVRLTSRPGEGATVTVRLPLTMSILDGLSVRIGTQIFVLPLTGVVESFRPKPDQVHPVVGAGEVVRARGETIPLLRPGPLLGVACDATEPSKAILCILDAGLSRVALMVDELVGQTQAVVRPLEQNYRRIDGVLGATVLGDGGVALILDITALARRGTSIHPREKAHATVRPRVSV